MLLVTVCHKSEGNRREILSRTFDNGYQMLLFWLSKDTKLDWWECNKFYHSNFSIWTNSSHSQVFWKTFEDHSIDTKIPFMSRHKYFEYQINNLVVYFLSWYIWRKIKDIEIIVEEYTTYWYSSFTIILCIIR
jgi:hypothetical protein